jgi:predicted Zn finger-like uncharacterized protein
MKITCQACQAKYTIADEKVSGKVVKIRCKKCGATIVVNGNDPSAVASQPPELGGASDDAPHTHAHEPPERWTVHVAEGDERTMTEPELVAAYQASVVTDDTFCWKEGMADWLPVVEIAALHAACTSPSAASAGGDFPGKSQEGVAQLGAGASAPPSPPGASRSPSKDRNGSPAASSHAVSPAPPVAARRAGGRAAAADLFGGVAQAGGEDEVMTSAPPAVPQAHADPQRPVAARADHRSDGSSSRDAGGAAPPSMTATTEASGLIDIRQLGAQMRSSSEEKKKSRVDDIMNLGGGGAFSPSLAAPVLSAPSLEHYSQPPPGLLSGPVATQVKSNALLIVALCAGLFFLMAAVGVGVLIFRGGPVAVDDRERAAASAGAATATAGSSGTAASASAAATVEAPPASAAHTSEAAGSVPRPSDSASGAAPAAAASKESTAENTAPHAPAAAPKAFVPAAPKEAPAAAPAGGAEFNLGEARARLASISGGVQTCKRGDTSGSGKVEIVFAPSGAAQSATLMGGSPFDGTPTGKCVEARFRQARVPPFGGSPMPVTKSFTIN